MADIAEQNDSPLVEAVIPADVTEVAAAPVTKNKPDRGGFFWGTGRRKSSVARVRIRPGKGEMIINKRKLDEYFTQSRDRSNAVAPLKATNTIEGLDVFVNVKGGGTSGQAGAVMLGVARALRKYDESLMGILRETGYLTRDSRMVERKKPGQKGARKKFQFSKR